MLDLPSAKKKEKLDITNTNSIKKKVEKRNVGIDEKVGTGRNEN